MAKAGQAQEPSMEEILASIRRIIADENGGAKDAPKPAAPKLAVVPNEPAPAEEELPQAMEEQEPLIDQDEVDDILELSEELAVPASPKPSDMATDDGDVAFAEPQPLELPVPPPPMPASPMPSMNAEPEPTPQPTPQPARRLLSQRSDEAVHTAFNHLANTILSQNARTLEDLVRDMLRPMLKTWLDDNLPPLVERLVREEIERVSRGRR